jgi:hypothetical protein
MAFSVAQIPMVLLAGRLGDLRTPLWAMGAVGTGLLVVGAAVWLVRPTVVSAGATPAD